MGTAVVGLLSHLQQMPDFTSQMVTMIGLGVGIDYACSSSPATATAYAMACRSRRRSLKPSTRAVALIMVCVFGAFVLGDDRSLKLFGLGLAAAVAIDATIVRMLLVPAAMELLGNRNWWMPKWIDRLLPKIDVEGHHHSTSPVAPTEDAGEHELTRV